MAQITQQAAPIGMVVLERAATGSLGLAGLVAAGFSLGAGAARPAQGRAIDRIGPRPVLLACGVIHVGAVLGVCAAAGCGAAPWTVVALSTAAGAGLPPVSASMRVALGRNRLAVGHTAAHSLAYLTQGLAVLLGPLLLAAVTAIATVSLALVCLATVSGAGTAALAFTIRGADGRASVSHRGTARGRNVMLLLAVVAMLGCAIGGLEVAGPALALAYHRPAATGLLMATLSLGGVIGAIGYGAREWSAPPVRRLVCLEAVVLVLLVPLPLVGSLPEAGSLLLLTGLVLDPTLISTSLLIHEFLAGRAAEGFGWMSSAMGLGAAVGSTSLGLVGQHEPLPRALLVVPPCVFVALVLTAPMARRWAG